MVQLYLYSSEYKYMYRYLVQTCCIYIYIDKVNANENNLTVYATIFVGGGTIVNHL